MADIPKFERFSHLFNINLPFHIVCSFGMFVNFLRSVCGFSRDKKHYDEAFLCINDLILRLLRMELAEKKIPPTKISSTNLISFNNQKFQKQRFRCRFAGQLMRFSIIWSSIEHWNDMLEIYYSNHQTIASFTIPLWLTFFFLSFLRIYA